MRLAEGGRSRVREGRSALIYQHFGRSETQEAFVAAAAARLWSHMPGGSIFAFETAHIVFLLAASPEQDAGAMVDEATNRKWAPEFFKRGGSLQAVPI